MLVALAVAPWTSKACPGIAPVFATVVSVPPRLIEPCDEPVAGADVDRVCLDPQAASKPVAADPAPATRSRRRRLTEYRPDWFFKAPRFATSCSLRVNHRFDDRVVR